MPLTCISNDAILKKPTGLDYTNPAKTLPFTLNGAPFANKPQSIVWQDETVSYVVPGTPGKVASATSPAVAATADSIAYKTIRLNTQNIIGADSATTLKYENKTYKQKFIAIHKGIWGDSRPYVSILLLSPENDFFHICIPLDLRNGEQDENLFLKYWLHGGTPPGGFTLNQILNFRGPYVNSVDFAIIQYCLKYNRGANINPYTLCIFKQSIYVNIEGIPWISTFAEISKQTFDSVLNYMLSDMFKNTDGRITSTEEHFSSNGTTTVPIPTFFNVKSSELVGKGIFSQGTPSKKLNNIKCYPIDLFNQIDDEGNIFIDEDSKKPIDITSVNDPSADIVKDSTAELKRQQSLNNLSFIVVFSILFGIICIILIILTVWFFSGRPAVEAAKNVAVAAAVVSVATPGSPTKSLFSLPSLFKSKTPSIDKPRPGSVKAAQTSYQTLPQLPTPNTKARYQTLPQPPIPTTTQVIQKGYTQAEPKPKGYTQAEPKPQPYTQAEPKPKA